MAAPNIPLERGAHIEDTAEAVPRPVVALVDAPTGAETARGELADGVLRAAGALHALGVRREERVLMVIADRPSFPEAFWGAMTRGPPIPEEDERRSGLA